MSHSFVFRDLYLKNYRTWKFFFVYLEFFVPLEKDLLMEKSSLPVKG